MLAEIGDRPRIPELPTRGVREKDLTSMPGRHNTGSPVDVESDIRAVDEAWRSRVDAHANANLVTLGP